MELEFTYKPHFQIAKIQRHFVTDQEIQLMLNLFNGKIRIQYIDICWHSIKCNWIRASFYCNDENPVNRFALVNDSFESLGINEIVWIVERDFQLEAGLACWQSTDTDNIGFDENYSENYNTESGTFLLPVTFERIMRLPLQKRIQFMNSHNNYSHYKQQEIIGLNKDKINLILDIS